MTTPDGQRQAMDPSPVSGPADASSLEADPQILRIGRIGKKLFGAAHCIVAFGTAPAAGTAAAPETAFCRSLPLADEPVAVPDTRKHPQSGAPHIRFYAWHPIYGQEYGQERQVVGRIALLDHAPRPGFGEDERQLLADLAALVERELQLRSVSALQLDLQKKNKNLRRKSLIDPLIGTWNRGAIMRILTIEAIRCDKAGVPLSLIVADLDYFKKINDTYGHQAGDAVLVKVASRLRSCIRPQEALGRYGGEEFLIVLPGASGAVAMTVAERMRQAVAAQPEAIGGAMLSLTLSAGVASTDMFPAATTEELISRADMALYAAKDAGRNRVVKATPELS